jgi:hypothetical protein
LPVIKYRQLARQVGDFVDFALESSTYLNSTMIFVCDGINLLRRQLG